MERILLCICLPPEGLCLPQEDEAGTRSARPWGKNEKTLQKRPLPPEGKKHTSLTSFFNTSKWPHAIFGALAALCETQTPFEKKRGRDGTPGDTVLGWWSPQVQSSSITVKHPGARRHRVSHQVTTCNAPASDVKEAKSRLTEPEDRLPGPFLSSGQQPCVEQK